MFEEIPSLGIAGDTVMTLASEETEPAPDFHIGIPPNSEITENLVGYHRPIGPRRPEIAQRLTGYGITSTHFREYVRGTRFNLNYIKGLSDIVGKFKVEKVVFKNLGMTGGETQAIITRPSEVNEIERWNVHTVQPTSASTSSTAMMMGAAYCFGFQLHKEDGAGENRAAQTAN